MTGPTLIFTRTPHAWGLIGYGPVIARAPLHPLLVYPPVSSDLISGSLRQVEALMRALCGVCGALRVNRLVEARAGLLLAP